MAGGKGTRLSPLTRVINKHFLPIFNKPMIYYSLSILIYSGIKEILIVCNIGDDILFKKLFKKIIKKYKIKIIYKFQKNKGGGIVEGLTIGFNFIDKADKTALILGDNFFYGRLFPKLVKECLVKKTKKSFIFLSKVSNPNNYGVAYFNKNKLSKIVEKPLKPRSDYAVTGLYIYNKNVLSSLKKIKPSKRNELEISSLNNILLKKKELDYINIGRGTTWFDLGEYQNMFHCAEFIQLIEKRQGSKVCDL